jgi:MFS family permease
MIWKNDKQKNNTFFIWVYFFFIGAIIPATSGIIIVSLPENLRGDGFSITNILLNLLGNFPASFAYSFLLDIFIKKNNGDKSLGHQDAMKYIMFYNFVGLISIVISMIFRLNQQDEESKDKILHNNTTE